MRSFILFVFVSTLSLADTRYESPSTILVKGEIREGVFETDSEDAAQWKQEVLSQLQFIVGNFEQKNTPSLGHTLNLEFKEKLPGESAKFKVSYKAIFSLAWTRPYQGSSLPTEVKVILPKRSDGRGLELFSEHHLNHCGQNPLWYYFKPKSAGCALGKNPLPSDAQFTKIYLSTAKNSWGKYPEYGKIWEDGKLVITHVMGNVDSDDAFSLHSLFEHETDVVSFEKSSDSFVTRVSQFSTQAGRVIVRTLQITKGNVEEQEKNPDFVAEFKNLQKEADVISYNGHAGFGENSRAFTRLIDFTPAKYYLVWINACVPFAYLDDTLMDAQKRANPASAWSKHLDIAILTQAGIFQYGSDIQALIRVLTQKQLSYSQFLNSLSSHGPAVLGEEDNQWPKPF